MIEEGGKIYKGAPGVLAQAVIGAVIQHNTIRNMFYTGVLLGAYLFV